MRTRAGSPESLGATCTGGGVNFAVYSGNATGVELCLFDERGNQHLVDMAHCSDGVWHIHVDGLGAGQKYGFRAHGPWQPDAGHRFNPAKLLLDPYARALTGRPVVTPAHYDFPAGAQEPLEPDRIDSAPSQPRCIVTTGRGRPFAHPRTPLADSLIYEVHVKGFSRIKPGIPEAARGRYAGLAHADTIAYLASLGVTAVELLPVYEFADESFVTDRGLVNYWGYNPIGFFAPTLRYAVADPAGEFQALVRALHDANIEVILDVVYNHTAEGGRLGPTFSFRGLDNAGYYRLEPDNPGVYSDDSGCGNSLDLEQPAVLRLVLDSLRFWVREMGVDGFRFDLATSLGRGREGYRMDAAFFRAVRGDPLLREAKLIAEPWDLGPGGYRLGEFPEGWSEWNDRYRNTVRRFWKGERGLLPAFAGNIHGSSDLFEHRGRPPQASINHVTSHDGFTLADLVSHESKHNEANLENNADGHDHNHSFNCGVEGPTGEAGVVRMRRKQQRNLLTTLLVSQGVPMLLAGDEFGRTQQGNNNGYCQDNETSWLGWDSMDHDLLAYVRKLARLRARLPELRCTRYIHGRRIEPHAGPDEIGWYHVRGSLMSTQDWHDDKVRALGLLLRGESMFDDPAANLVYILFNAGADPVSAHLPQGPVCGDWRCELSSALDGPAEGAGPGGRVEVEACSVSVFVHGGRE